ncbi:MAG: hypothetical protein KUG73_03215 [Pseudomonadales bacterium]|nr:hypothetical protein [Pseudomonadales bacterium]
MHPIVEILLVKNAKESVLETIVQKMWSDSCRFICAHFFNSLSQHYDSMTPLLKESVARIKESSVLSSNNADEVATSVDVTGLLKNWDVPLSLGNKISEFDVFTDFDQMTPDTQIHTASIDDITRLLQLLSNKRLLDSDELLDVCDVRSALKESLGNLSEEGYLTVIDSVSESILNLVNHLFDESLESVAARIQSI